MKWQKIVELARKACTERPDNKYPGVDSDGNTMDFCKYTDGVCTDNTIGCIFGQILPHDEFGLVERDSDYLAYGIREILRDNCEDIPESVVEWCGVLQSRQDDEYTWGNALIEAEHEYGEIVNQLLAENPCD